MDISNNQSTRAAFLSEKILLRWERMKLSPRVKREIEENREKSFKISKGIVKEWIACIFLLLFTLYRVDWQILWKEKIIKQLVYEIEIQMAQKPRKGILTKFVNLSR